MHATPTLQPPLSVSPHQQNAIRVLTTTLDMMVFLKADVTVPGLIATEAGTLGRLTGNAALAIVGHITDTETNSDLKNFSRILYCFFVVVLAAVQLCVFVLWRKFRV